MKQSKVERPLSLPYVLRSWRIPWLLVGLWTPRAHLDFLWPEKYGSTGAPVFQWRAAPTYCSLAAMNSFRRLWICRREVPIGNGDHIIIPVELKSNVVIWKTIFHLRICGVGGCRVTLCESARPTTPRTEHEVLVRMAVGKQPLARNAKSNFWLSIHFFCDASWMWCAVCGVVVVWELNSVPMY